MNHHKSLLYGKITVMFQSPPTRYLYIYKYIYIYISINPNKSLFSYGFLMIFMCQTTNQNKLVELWPSPFSLHALGAAGHRCLLQLPYRWDTICSRWNDSRRTPQVVQECTSPFRNHFRSNKKTSSDTGKTWKHGNIGFIGRMGFNRKKTEAHVWNSYQHLPKKLPKSKGKCTIHGAYTSVCVW